MSGAERREEPRTAGLMSLACCARITASLLIHEGRLSVVEIAAQLGHNPTVCPDTYAHVMAEQVGGERVSAEQQIALARAAVASADGHAQLSFAGFDV